jgi:hypothetical protein
MSIFLCHECQNLRDADDGCEATEDGLNLICIDCMEDAAIEAEHAEWAASRSQYDAAAQSADDRWSERA